MLKQQLYIMALILVMIFSIFTVKVFGYSTKEYGLAIAREADQRTNGFGDFTAKLEMILRNAYGDESVRNLRNQTLEVERDGDKTLTIFDYPPDVKGTVMLTVTHKIKHDDQWLYIPAIKRVKRIASANKAGPFMGSEFAYEDISSQEVEKYTYNFLREENYMGQKCYVVERFPVSSYSGYTRQVVWFDKAEYRFIKIDFYDRKNTLLKTLTFHNYKKYLGRFWRASKTLMINHQTDKSTQVNWRNYHFRTGLTNRDFNRSSLKRIR